MSSVTVGTPPARVLVVVAVLGAAVIGCISWLVSGNLVGFDHEFTIFLN